MILDQELAVHRELLAIARLRHRLLREGRFGGLYALRVAELARLSTLRRLEAARAPLEAAETAEVREIAPRIAAIIRQLGRVERANQALLVRHMVRARHPDDGVAVWTPL
ncbi:MAG: hypothetical protein QN141_03570 [Armatimonadota bacterium]|nr:hypothetical protein [Armatimonadota bacterium]MDR7500338.1 hypothetical protein [Armatimonadota bacterium]MDR7503560.1 hypothetical protein [Armatimonadota bacterium]MDR7545811.1 hypothetical protein [Armatimonadota bacterium]MDR7551490.1 hypothetical protein [Armatimonadota bacterium]